MIEITYYNESKQEKIITYDDMEALERAQHSCNILIADYLKVKKLLVNGKELDYKGNFGDLYFYLSQENKH
ncbi:DUF4649 family protein [Streptococcus iniae]|uniref:DUF4649 family protein n=1 Tax=Streptococcus iniae TaxID=1346 RepID=A0A1J0MZ02_STRIN|nr:DUF4649 family protein [Streptococcus iniae]AGM98875.1 hypothetical protein K710_1103 [Streptococcus iniae SF1]AHY15833.1 hypothetical protein DQ08_05055 [Streptococcus iniae]AHY17701.1 hypothetical protein DW64_05050 [Streptococcus iniae]AJG25995.1 hypothetical protein SI82_05245 [Streptococcus iniae]APD31870.1 DUF4649 domain-containing protein [Streptococcus iniae]